MSYSCPTLFSLHVNKYLPVIAGIKQDIWKSMLSVQYPWPQYPGSLKGDQDNRRLSLGFFHRWKREVLQFWSSYILYYILNVIYTLQYAFFANINYWKFHRSRTMDYLMCGAAQLFTFRVVAKWDVTTLKLQMIKLKLQWDTKCIPIDNTPLTQKYFKTNMGEFRFVPLTITNIFQSKSTILVGAWKIEHYSLNTSWWGRLLAS